MHLLKFLVVLQSQSYGFIVRVEETMLRTMRVDGLCLAYKDARTACKSRFLLKLTDCPGYECDSLYNWFGVSRTLAFDAQGTRQHMERYVGTIPFFRV